MKRELCVSVAARASHMEMVFCCVFVFFLHLAPTEHNSFSTELCLNIFSNALMSWQIERSNPKKRTHTHTHWQRNTEWKQRLFVRKHSVRTFDLWLHLISDKFHRFVSMQNTNKHRNLPTAIQCCPVNGWRALAGIQLRLNDDEIHLNGTTLWTILVFHLALHSPLLVIQFQFKHFAKKNEFHQVHYHLAKSHTTHISQMITLQTWYDGDNKWFMDDDDGDDDFWLFAKWTKAW